MSPSRYYHSKLTRKGQATIPIEIREQLGMKEGDNLVWRIENGMVSVTTSREHVRGTAGMLKPYIDPAISAPTIAEMKEAIAAAVVEDYLQSESRS